MMIDTTRLPPNALVDTGVFIRFLGHRQDDINTSICKAFCDAMIGSTRPIYVAAPTVAEVTRHHGHRGPRTRGIVVVPFDKRAAELLGLHMPMAKVHETADSTGIARTYLKFDAMIAACALRARTAAIVALDATTQ